ncbi:hypothetical protein COV61_00255 [Candidatus Micrarchaeota archaeon CG11_big_fil_rev_8_21_14_0_20_47_5]|nr:MAG: hypothetical protein AUJ17_04305 [Candidatus Micrarchaeota archaeon CG1_02_47_40]PIN84398.1 MAG: hypothetical protein COV61_00255 [Candidatus Micrarchaeota archaeon CG11_big_fil_rev_8_21_14_0_20_47_5]
MPFVDILQSAEMGIFAVSMALMVFVVAAIYMIAQLVKRPEWEAYARVETHQIFFSALILIMALLIVNMMEDVSKSMLGGKDYFDVAQEYLDKLVVNLLMPTLMQMEGIVIGSQLLSGISHSYGAGTAWGVRFALFPQFSLFESVFEFVLMVITPFSASIMAQQFGLHIIHSTMIAFVLPAGIILRIFPATRDAGVFLISTAFGFYFVFPLTYVMHYDIMKYIDAKDTGIDFLGVPDAPGAGDPLGGIEPAYDPNSSFYKRVFGNSFDLSWMLHPFANLSVIIMQAIFLPGLSMIITNTFIKSMIKFLGQKF